MAQVLNLTLSSFVFDGSHSALQRDRIGDHSERDATYDDRYDFHTFFYDCYHDSGVNEVVLVCPSLLNFEHLAKKTVYFIDGTEIPIKSINPISRGDVIRFGCPSGNPKKFTFVHDLFSGEVDVNVQHHDVFEGKNAIYAISKDNKLEWMQDWLAYYVKEHGANAAVIYDNGSTAYPLDVLTTALADLDGMQAVAVVNADFPFGPGGSGKTNFISKFLHMTMVELGRRRLLSTARAVLNVDIDELVYARNGESIFDATVKSEKGYIRFGGRWVYADPPNDSALIVHADHWAMRKDGRPNVNRKWCVAPLGPLNGHLWLTHRIISRKDPKHPNFGFWHFRRLTNNWDYSREDFDTDLLVPDARLQTAMKRVFGASAGPETHASPQLQTAKTAPAPEPKDRRSLIITSVKNQGPYILEWIAYHRVIGFDDFLVYSTECSDGTVEILDRLQTLGILTHERNKSLPSGPRKSAPKYASDHPLTKQVDWILVSDIDEFLNVKIGEGRLQDLYAAQPNANIIPVTKKLFTNSTRSDYSNGLVIEDYTDGEPSISNNGQRDRLENTLFRNDPRIERFGTDGPIISEQGTAEFHWQAPDDGPVDDSSPTRPEKNSAYDAAQINHYATQSVDSFLVKHDCGPVGHDREIVGIEYWEKMNKGGQQDHSILRWSDVTKTEIQRLRQDAELARLCDMAGRWHQAKIAELKAIPEIAKLRLEILGSESKTLARQSPKKVNG